MTLRPEDLRDLRDKYVELLRLRAEHDSPDPPAPGAALALLAARFPGALRELDATPLAELEARLAAVDACLTGKDEALPPWLVATHRFHRLARGALAIKRWIAEERPTPETIATAFRGALARGAVPAEAADWEDRLLAIASPPGGRLMPLVHAAVGASLGISAGAAKTLVLRGDGRAVPPAAP